MPQPIGGRSPLFPASPSTPSTPASPQPATPGPVDTFTPTTRTFPTSDDGTPLFSQGDAEWRARRLGSSATLGESGCAVTATAMALSKITGEVITPASLDEWLDRHRGYSGDALDWSRLGPAKRLLPELRAFSLAAIDESLAAGRPVVLGVDYKPGSGGGANGTDHWVCVTARTVAPDGSISYQANDPGTGNVVTLTPERGGRLVGDGVGALGTYRSSGQLRVFTDV